MSALSKTLRSGKTMSVILSKSCLEAASIVYMFSLSPIATANLGITEVTSLSLMVWNCETYINLLITI
jgi:hypothetical protein